jgi:hypothetical protein
MLCYRDRTYCGFYAKCAHGPSCSRALTPDIQEEADRARLPISQWAEEPTCFDHLPIQSQYAPSVEEPED